MTAHLSSDDQLAALDGHLAPDRQAHLTECASCRESVTHAKAVVDAMRSDAVPEPSPLFWDHFSDRVRAATAAESVTRVSRFGWRVWATLASAAVAFAMVFVVRNGVAVPQPPVPDAVPVTVSAPVAPTATSDIEPLAAVMQMASSLSSDDVNGIVSAAGGDAPLVDDLTPAERAAFVRLLHAEMEKVQ